MSIIVPVYNRAELVKATLMSLGSQTARPIEVILIDNNSNDGSRTVLEKWQRDSHSKGFDINVDICETPGAAAARNKGLELARSEWIMFFDSDDIMPPRHVATALDAIAKHPEADIIGWDYVSSDGRNRHVNRFFGRDMMWNNLFHGAMSSARWCARRSLVERAGKWNENVHYWDDIELGTRMLKLEPGIYYMGMSGIEVLEHPASITGRNDADPQRIEAALESISAVSDKALWCDIKRAIEYGLASRAGNSRGRELQNKLTNRSKPCRRLLLDFAYWHTRAGMCGAASLLKPFCRLFR